MNQYDIEFNAETASAISNVNRLDAEIKQLTASVHAVGAAASVASPQLDALTNQTTQLGTSFSHVHEKAGGLKDAMLELGSGAEVIMMLVGLLSQLSETMNAARDRLKQLTDDFIELRDKMAEAGGLMGHDGPDDEVVAAVLKLGVNSGLLPEEANEFMKKFEGSIPAARQKGNINAQTEAELKEFAPRFGNQQQIKPGTAGDFAGVIGQYEKVPSLEAGARTMGRVVAGLKLGRGDTEPLLRSLIKTAGGVVAEGGAVPDLAELSTLLGVASTHAEPEAAGTQLRQAVRTLRKVSGPEGEYLKANGVKDGMTHVQRLRAIKPAVEAEARRTGEGMDQVVKRHLTKNDAEARSIGQSLADLDIIEARLKDSEKVTGKQVLASVDRYAATDGYNKFQKAKTRGQQMLAGHAEERMRQAMETANQQMIDNKELTVEDRGWDAFTDSYGITGSFGGLKAREKRTLARATGNLIAEAKRIGMSDDDIYGMTGLGMDQVEAFNPAEKSVDQSPEAIRRRNFESFSSTQQGWGERRLMDGYKQLAHQVRSHGGNDRGAMPDVGRHFDKLAEEQRKTNALLAGIQRQGQARPAPANFVGPPAPRAGNAAAAPRRP